MATTTTTAALDQLRAAFSDKVAIITPDVVSEYEAAVTQPWSQTCWIPAAGYVYPNSAQELSKALSIFKNTGTKFSIRGSGHNPNVGLGSADQAAIVLDIRQLRSKQLDSDGIARVGSGSTWGEVYAWLEEEHKLSAIGARQQQVGVGGFLLGGGMGALPNLYGLGADGVKNFEVLLADSRLVNANANENADLYRALKGGGSNFGIVTRFDLETHPLINIQYTINLYNPEDYIELIKATVAVQEAMENDNKLGLFTNFNQGFVAVGLLYGDTPAEWRVPAFEPFYNLTSLMTTAVPVTNGTLNSLSQAMGHAQEPMKRAICTVTTKPSRELYEEVYKTWTNICQSLPAGCVLHYTIQPMGTAGIQAGKDRGENIMGLENIPQCWWVFTAEWPKDDGCDDATVQNAVNVMGRSVQSLAKERGLLLDHLCMTFATASQKVLRSYGAENVKRMQDVASKYDPEGVFQNLQKDGFLLRNNI